MQEYFTISIKIGQEWTNLEIWHQDIDQMFPARAEDIYTGWNYAIISEIAF